MLLHAVLGAAAADLGARHPGRATSTGTASTARTCGGSARCSPTSRRGRTCASWTGSGSARWRPPHRAVVDGDTKSAAIAAASIVAKVTRDRIMRRLDALYPRYGFSRTSATSRPCHSAAVRAHGPCDQHRLSYAAKCYGAEPSSPRGVNRGERRALWHYRLRGYRVHRGERRAPAATSST